MTLDRPVVPRGFLRGSTGLSWSDLERTRYLRDLVAACRRRLAAMGSHPHPPFDAITREQAALRAAEKELARIEAETFLF